jgi:hypothetical protein
MPTYAALHILRMVWKSLDVLQSLMLESQEPTTSPFKPSKTLTASPDCSSISLAQSHLILLGNPSASFFISVHSSSNIEKARPVRLLSITFLLARGRRT